MRAIYGKSNSGNNYERPFNRICSKKMKIPEEIKLDKSDWLCFMLCYGELYSLYWLKDFGWKNSIFSPLFVFVQTVNSHYLLLGVTFVLLYALCIFWLSRIITKIPIRVGHCSLYLMTLICLFVEMTRHTNYIPLFSVIASSALVALVFEIAKLKTQKQTFKPVYRSGFVTDTVNAESIEDVGWEKYADSLLQRLLHTDVSQSAFAIALTGPWGAGKTTFLSLMKTKFALQDIPYVEYNPWQDISAHSIIKNFFDLVKTGLNKRDINVNSDIDRYVSKLAEASKIPIFENLPILFESGGTPIMENMKGKISNALSMLDSPMFVLVDDIDRLQKDELWEVLKLVRKTADFKNTIFVVTFAKDYVANTLSKDDPQLAIAYLKKIFQLELSFPVFESYLFTHLLTTKLNEHIGNKPTPVYNILSNIDLLLCQQDVHIQNYFQNFRDVKRFVNELVVDVDYICSQNRHEDFHFKDFFVLQLLRQYDSKTYEILRNDSYRLVQEVSYDKKYLSLREDESLKLLDISAATKKLLLILFPQQDKRNLPADAPNRIWRTDRLYNYFSYRPFEYQISITEFNHILHSDNCEEVGNFIQKCRNGLFDKGYSIYSLMREVNVKHLDEKSKKNLVCLMSEWVKAYPKYNPGDIKYIHQQVLAKTNFELHQFQEIKDILTFFWKELAENPKYYAVLQKILCGLIPMYMEHDSEGMEIFFPDTIFSEEEIRTLIHNNTVIFLKKVKPSIESIADKSSRLHEFLVNSIVYSEYQEKHPDHLAIESELIEYYKAYKDVNSPQYFMRMFKYVEDWHFQEGAPTPEEELRESICTYFFSVSFYKKFMQECFTYNEEKALERYFKENKLT